MNKTPTRYFMSKPIRTIWDDNENCWYFATTDLINVLTETKNARKYWNTLKSRNIELSSICRQLKLYAEDKKQYLTDVISQKDIKKIMMLIPSKNKEELQKWLLGTIDSIDEQSKKRAYKLYDNNLIDPKYIGKTKSLQQIHGYLFAGLYDFAGKIRTLTISKNGFTFANGDFLPTTLKNIDKMPESTFDEIINKYIEMNLAHPFMEGNGRSTRIWLDLILKKNLKKCVDWSKINKNDYLDAMRSSHIKDIKIKKLLLNALTNKINDREIFMKGIDYSYYYESEDDIEPNQK